MVRPWALPSTQGAGSHAQQMVGLAPFPLFHDRKEPSLWGLSE